MGYSQTVRKKKIREPVKVSQGLKMYPITDYDLLLCPMLIVIVEKFDKFTLIFGLTE